MVSISEDETSFLELLRSRRQDAFAALYDKYAGPLYGVICRKVQDTDKAQNILQDVFVKVWKDIRNFDPVKSRFFIWMYHISLDICNDYLNNMVFDHQIEHKKAL